MVKTKKIDPGPADEAFRADMLKLLDKHSGKLPADRMLALAAYTVGQLIAMQDQRRFTSESVMALVSQNIQSGNQHAITDLLNKTQGHG